MSTTDTISTLDVITLLKEELDNSRKFQLNIFKQNQKFQERILKQDQEYQIESFKLLCTILRKIFPEDSVFEDSDEDSEEGIRSNRRELTFLALLYLSIVV